MRAEAFALEEEGVTRAPRRCRECGCDQLHACPGGCSWVEYDLCSACADKSICDIDRMAAGQFDAEAELPVRDPRMDPQPGDVLAVGSDVREVWDRVDGRIEYGFPGKAATRWLTLILWQTWARHADVQKVAA